MVAVSYWSVASHHPLQSQTDDELLSVDSVKSYLQVEVDEGYNP